jgi:hypothetical protein
MIPFYRLPWYERPQFPTLFQRFLLWFKPIHKTVEGSVTIYYKKLGNTCFVIETVTRFL